jgi:predicted amidophosphoribosyltransferase
VIGSYICADYLDKVRTAQSTASQVELKGDERRQNLKGGFAPNPKIQLPDSIRLFDDVFTTGSTIREAAKVLKRAVVKKVWALTIAR